MLIDWPNKERRESFEIKKFIEHYEIHKNRKFTIENKQECPDYILIDFSSGNRIGIELSSVYIDNRSIPDKHIKSDNCYIADDENKINQLKEQIIEKITEKIKKAQKHYNKKYPLILSIYMNEYESIYLEKEDLQEFVVEHESIFSNIYPFCEIFFWNLPNDGFVSVKPCEKNQLQT